MSEYLNGYEGNVYKEFERYMSETLTKNKIEDIVEIRVRSGIYNIVTSMSGHFRLGGYPVFNYEEGALFWSIPTGVGGHSGIRIVEDIYLGPEWNAVLKENLKEEVNEEYREILRDRKIHDAILYMASEIKSINERYSVSDELMPIMTSHLDSRKENLIEFMEKFTEDIIKKRQEIEKKYN
jgi:hypothetical protein